MEISPISLRVHLHAGDHLQGSSGGSSLGLGDARRRVVVGQGDHQEATFQRQTDNLRRRQHTVGGGAVDVEVDAVWLH